MTVACNGVYSPEILSTTSKLSWTFTFTATNSVSVSVSTCQTLTEKAPPATVTGTTVTMAFTSSATNGLSTSLTVDYTVSLSATCSYSNGSTAPCALPDGTVSGSSTAKTTAATSLYLSSPASNCTAAVGGSVTGDGCDVTWSTYGDQWFTATYTSPSASSVAQTIEVQVVAPLDFGSGLSYSTYGNAGPGAIGDCTMASVADWIQTTLGTVPSDQDTIDAYWAAEDEFNGGADVGLTPPQLFSYWTAQRNRRHVPHGRQLGPDRRQRRRDESVQQLRAHCRGEPAGRLPLRPDGRRSHVDRRRLLGLRTDDRHLGAGDTDQLV